MNNTTGGGTTLATVKVDRGSTFVSSVVISSGSIAPTITFTIPSKTFGNAPFTLTPNSNSPGAFTFTSSNTSVATISGSTVTIVANGTSTITATQASSGDYSSATATATLTVGVAGTVAAPAFSTAAGAIAFPTTITLSSTTAGATIYYTIDGTTPTTGSTQGTSVVVNSAQTIKAFAIKTGYTDSSISSAAYTQAQATEPTSITLAVGSTTPVGGVTNVAIPSAGATDSTGAVTGWISSTANKIKFTVANGGSASSAITVNGVGYTNGENYTITAASTLTVVVTTTETGKTTATRTFSISVAAEPTFTSTGLIINYDASNFSNGASTWTNLGTGGATYNGVVTGSLSRTGTSPAAISIGGNGSPQTKYISTNYVTNDAAWTIEVIAKALSIDGSGDSLIRKDGSGTGWWFGAQGGKWLFRNQTAGADTNRHVITFGSNGKIWIDGVLKNTIDGTQNSTGAITIITGVTGNTWEISRFKYYDRTLTDAEITSNSSKQKTELGF
jgi:hypothetical protein